jgi:hypothetical protein
MGATPVSAAKNDVAVYTFAARVCPPSFPVHNFPPLRCVPRLPKLLDAVGWPCIFDSAFANAANPSKHPAERLATGSSYTTLLSLRFLYASKVLTTFSFRLCFVNRSLMITNHLEYFYRWSLNSGTVNTQSRPCYGQLPELNRN